MPPDTLEFEEPIAVLVREIEALSMLPRTPERQRSIDGLHRRIDSIRGDIYRNLTPWQRVLVARHPGRPTVLDYVNRLFTDFTEVSGDRRFADDHALVAGFARYKGEHVLVVGHHKGGGGDTKQKIYRNFGYANSGALADLDEREAGAAVDDDVHGPVLAAAEEGAGRHLDHVGASHTTMRTSTR